MGISPEILGKGMNLEDGQVIYNDLRDRIEETNQEVEAVDNQVIISDTQPSATSNKLWIDDSSGTEVSVPTYAEFEALSGAAVTDVQVNGTSVVSNGVANVPKASVSGDLGVVSVDYAYGVTINNQGRLSTNKASAAYIKNGASQFTPIVPYNQHTSAFYGLAKAAGADMASLSSTTVGEYPDAQKIAIQKMIGSYQSPWELISDYTTTENLETVDVLTDTNGEAFVCEEIYVRAYLPASTAGNADYFIAQAHTWLIGGTSGTCTLPTLRFSSATAYIYAEYKLELMAGIVWTLAKAGTSYGNTQTAQWSSSPEGVDYASFRGFRLKQYSASSTLIPSGTNIKIYGRRKWA